MLTVKGMDEVKVHFSVLLFLLFLLCRGDMAVVLLLKWGDEGVVAEEMETQ